MKLSDLIARMDTAAIFIDGDDCAGSNAWRDLKAELTKGLGSGVEDAFSASMDGDSPLQAAAREAGWALMELIDAIDFTKRHQVAGILERLAVALENSSLSDQEQPEQGRLV